MYTNLDKAIVAFIMGAIGISPETVASLVGIATPILVYLLPNLPKDPPNA